MHIHILGICGTFMGGIARLASDAGHTVSGSDANVYPPMSTQLENLGIDIMDIEDDSQFDQSIDMVIVGNVMSRGYAAVEQLLIRRLPYTSGPQWLAENILRGRHVIAIAGTHGKTTTSSMLAWVLQDAGLRPGFLIGGVAKDFGESARLGEGELFVVEADEYDSAFFDKRSKFIHYRPNTLILNNLEFDHADIFDNLDQIKRQFQHLIRTVPGDGCILVNGNDASLSSVLAAGCWSQQLTFGLDCSACDWSASATALRFSGESFTNWTLPMPGEHNRSNALAAIAAAHYVGVDIPQAMESLSKFQGVARRLQLRGEVRGIKIYDDFAHHPTAINATISAVKQISKRRRVVAVLEPRSNTMKSLVHESTLASSLQGADQVWLYQAEDLAWRPEVMLAELADCHVVNSIDDLVEKLSKHLQPGDHVVIMSNGGFGNIHARLLDSLAHIHA